MQLLEIMGHLGAALIQQSPSDDHIIMGHVREANDIATRLYREIKAAQNPIDAHIAARASKRQKHNDRQNQIRSP